MFFALLVCLNVSAKSERVNVYAFGFAASFNDSTVYFTQIQSIDSVWIDNKTNFLDDRESYSYQLRDYLTSVGKANRTCIITFARTEKEIKKKYTALRKEYTENEDFIVKEVTPAEFSFKAVANFQNTQALEAEKKVASEGEKKK